MCLSEIVGKEIRFQAVGYLKFYGLEGLAERKSFHLCKFFASCEQLVFVLKFYPSSDIKQSQQKLPSHHEAAIAQARHSA